MVELTTDFSFKFLIDSEISISEGIYNIIISYTQTEGK